MEEIVNKIAKSGLVTFDLSELYDKAPRKSIDIKPWLWQEMVIKEKEFKTFLKKHDWTQYQGALVNVFCSIEAIIPNWAYMLISKELEDAKKVHLGTKKSLNELLFHEAIGNIDLQEFEDKRVLIKGCGEAEVPPSAYIMISQKLMPVVKSLMFGEACSNVPIYKKKSHV